MLAAIAEFEHDLIVERTHDGLAAARARGRNGGPKFKMTPNKIAQARAMYDDGKHIVQQIADTFGVSRPTVYPHLTDRRRPPPGRRRSDRRPVDNLLLAGYVAEFDVFVLQGSELVQR